MKTTDNQRLEILKADFEMLWCSKVQGLTALRRLKKIRELQIKRRCTHVPLQKHTEQ